MCHYRSFVEELTNMTRQEHPPLLSPLSKRLAERDDRVEENPCHGVLLSYSGLVDAGMIPHLVQLAERALHHCTRTRKESKRAMSVLIEAIQNVIHHGHIDSKGESALFLTLENTPLGYQLHCGNLMEDDTAISLGQRIGELNNLNHAQLRKRYIDVLCDGGQDPLRGNAGLGLIDIAKKTEGPIEFLVEPHDSGLRLVTLTSTIRR